MVYGWWFIQPHTRALTITKINPISSLNRIYVNSSRARRKAFQDACVNNLSIPPGRPFVYLRLCTTHCSLISCLLLLLLTHTHQVEETSQEHKSREQMTNQLIRPRAFGYRGSSVHCARHEPTIDHSCLDTRYFSFPFLFTFLRLRRTSGKHGCALSHV